MKIKSKLYSLKIKITLIIWATSLFFGIILIGVFYSYLTHALVNLHLNNISLVINEQSNFTSKILKDYQDTAKNLAEDFRVYDYLQNSGISQDVNILNIFLNQTRGNNNFLAIYLLDQDGIVLVSTDPRFVGQNYSFRDYFKTSFAGIPFSDVAIGKTSNQFGFYFSFPVKNQDGVVLGVLVVKTDNKEINASIIESQLATEGRKIMLTDKFGIILVSSESERFLYSLGNIIPENKEKIIQTDKFLGKEIIPLQYSDVQHEIDTYTTDITLKLYDPIEMENEYFFIKQLEDSQFYLVTEIGLDTVEETVAQLVIRILTIYFIGIILSSVIMYRMILIFIRPLGQLERLSVAINNGDFSQRAEVKTQDEFEELANAFNTMSENLGKSFNELKQKDKDLEKRIKERTSELQKVLSETDKLNKFMVNRELKMVELKKEIEKYKAELEKKKQT